MGKLLSLPEVASRTSTSVAFWRKVIGRKEVPVVKIGRLTRLREEDVDAFCRLGFLRKEAVMQDERGDHGRRG